MQTEELLIGDVADQVGIQTWRLRRLADRDLIPRPRLIGRLRVFRAEDIPKIREVALAAGYVRGELRAVTA